MFNDFESSSDIAMTKPSNRVDSGYMSHGGSKEKSAAKIGYGLREDVMKIWEELDQARNTLAEIQALLVEFEIPQKAMQGRSKYSQ